jgi:mono/diheme cytochrome c family protein
MFTRPRGPRAAGSSLLSAVFLVVAAAPALRAETPLERGQYLVEEVGKCGMCHTPLADGKPDTSKKLKGAVLTVQPIEPIKGWHKTAPDITPGSRLWQRWGEKGLLNYLLTGLNPNGKEADPPMPAYKFKQEDAEAVLAYLKSLQ